MKLEDYWRHEICQIFKDANSLQIDLRSKFIDLGIANVPLHLNNIYYEGADIGFAYLDSDVRRKYFRKLGVISQYKEYISSFGIEKSECFIDIGIDKIEMAYAYDPFNHYIFEREDPITFSELVKKKIQHFENTKVKK